MKNIFIPIFLILNIISISIYGRSHDGAIRTDTDSHPFKYLYKGVAIQGFTLDELWQFSKASPTISQQLVDLNWEYDEFRSYVRLGNYSGTRIGLGYITLNGQTDIGHGILSFTYQLNNAQNADQTAILADMAANGKIAESDLQAACEKIESAGVIDELLVAAEMNINTEAPFALTNMVQAYQSGEFNLIYLQNWTYRNCIGGTIFSQRKESDLPPVSDEVKSLETNKTDSFIQTLHNRDVSLTLQLVAPDKEFDDSGMIQPSVVMRILSSVDADLVKTTFPESLLIQKLMELLDDPDKDWYANLLLYNLTGKFPPIPSEHVLRVDNRIEWLKPMSDGGPTYKAIDVKMWERYFSGFLKLKVSM